LRGWGVRLSALLLLGLLLLALSLRAADFTAWPSAQPFNLTNAGLTRLDLPPATLDAARPDFADLRLADSAGVEVPYLVVQAAAGRVATSRARDLRVELLPDATQVSFATGLTQALGSVTLETPARSFIKSVTVEGSTDGVRWEALVRNQQIFREAGGAAQLSIALPRQPWPFLRLRVDDRSSPPVPFTGAEVQAAERDASSLLPVPIVITDRVENGTQTRLSLNLGAAHLRLASLRIETPDPLFRRALTLVARELQQDAVEERVLARGVIARVPGGPAADAEWKLDLLTPDRSLLLLIENADAPPLQVTGVQAERRPVEVLFYAAQPGRYTLYSGNRTCPAPRYDLPAQITAAGQTSLSAATLPALQANEQFRPPEALPDLSGTGAPLDPKDWKYRKPVELSAPGVQQLTLDLEILAHARAGLGDLRLVRDGRQLPFVLERTTRQAQVVPVAQPAPDAKQPALTRWELKLPVAAAPVVNFTCESPTPLFERAAVLYELAGDDRGNPYRRELGRANWRRAPDEPARTLHLTLHAQPQTDTLFLEINNGDNPALELRGFSLGHPVTRLVFSAPATDGIALYYGNPEAPAPQYDLRLVAAQLLAAEQATARTGPEQVLRGAAWGDAVAGTPSGWLLWVVLTGVVVALLAVIARLMPKPAG
jgi:hypothetical protein